jgi:hypothetical protein
VSASFSAVANVLRSPGFSSYLFKAAHSTWKNQVVGLEAGLAHICSGRFEVSNSFEFADLGSGMGALDRILRDDPGLFGMNPDTDKPYTAAQIYSFLRSVLVRALKRYIHGLRCRCYLISHSHLDHISSLVISAGSFGGQKRIYARDQTLRDLETVFADRIWPNLASYKKDAMLRYSSCARLPSCLVWQAVHHGRLGYLLITDIWKSPQASPFVRCL